MTIEKRIEFLIRSAESHDRQIGELTNTVATQTANIDKLVRVTNEDAIAIRTLARIADAHVARIADIDGNKQQ
jgi:hypothetical protein